MERWQEAANAYERAGQMDNVVRLYLTKLSEPDRACRIVRETLSITGKQSIYILHNTPVVVMAVKTFSIPSGPLSGSCLDLLKVH